MKTHATLSRWFIAVYDSPTSRTNRDAAGPGEGLGAAVVTASGQADNRELSLPARGPHFVTHLEAPRLSGKSRKEVEPFTKIRQNLFVVGVLAAKPSDPVLVVQATTGSAA